MLPITLNKIGEIGKHKWTPRDFIWRYGKGRKKIDISKNAAKTLEM